MLRPETEADLADIIVDADGPLAVQGGGTRGMTPEGEALSTSGLSGITLYEPGALTLVAQAGTPVAEIEAALAAENQRLAFEPMDHRALLGTSGEPTIGGVMAANVSGPRRIQAGAARDFLLGVRYVDGAGAIVKNGGRVMKNVTGYDLVKLMSGACGTLGVLSEVSFKVLPGVEAELTLQLSGLEDRDAVRAMSAALSSPYEVTAAAHDPATKVTSLRLEGFARSVLYRAGALTEALGSFGPAEVEQDVTKSRELWRSIRDVEAFAGAPGDVWRISTKPTDAPALVARLRPEAALYDWGGGLIWLRLPEGTDLRAKAGQIDGHATLVRGAPKIRQSLGMFQPQPAPLAALSAGLRARFDPRGILNAGLMG
ncbi:FAD-binding protein [Thalassococcus sp. S3]|uniref:FAD-binding protein n=1 Tax=Thalassococcus sp. S3 TaxID=2017482 RepID=UPI0010243D78|nr:FAD-binding protein [Thalassococcus sp. S3]QBF33178.1 2-hydroxy-acid oxidase [Thalassococcus sp. S3]